jgi:hypothetical protein
MACNEELLVERWEHQREIKNLMGKYSNCLILNREAEMFDLFWSRQKDDVCLGFNDGFHLGASAIKGYYSARHERAALVASLLKRRFPERLQDKSKAELFGMGTFQVKPLSCPVIEVAGDFLSAKGLWFSLGACAEAHSYGPSSNWTWGFCAADFTRENGAWRLWHLQCLNDVDSRCGASWAEPMQELPELPEFAELKSFAMPAPNAKAQLRRLYSPDRPLMPPPRLPEAYDTFSETFSYGAEAGI